MRGEYSPWLPHHQGFVELPPHARRIRYRLCFFADHGGTTSACAENTMTCSMPRKLYRNYLRMRGEYALPACHATSQSELPPHARRILQHVMDIETSQGTTSACAENTRAGQGGDDLERNYLRMRGEYRGLARRVAGITELPPHARRILHSLWGDQDIVGTTSACAENTADHQWAGIESWNYLRMRGEYLRLRTW